MKLLILLLMIGCVAKGTNESALFRSVPNIDGALNFATVQDFILGPQCVGCHAWAGDEALVRTRVVPGNPSASRLYTELASGRMPRGAAKLSPQQLKLVSDWIIALASDTNPPPQPIELKPTYASLKVHLLDKSCTMCHNSSARRLPSFETYEDVVDEADDIQYYLEFGAADGNPMPPLDRDGNPRAPVPTQAVVDAFKEWVVNGMQR
jgi:hypothetical protein